ncbi:MAG: tRNA lysidine(34) synthetase TilS [Burkholderiales bacterium]
MASSRKSKRNNSADDVAAHVAARLGSVVKAGDRLLLGLSGGVDSVVLLDVLARLRKRRRFELRALHVNHQLSPNAARWARFCRSACRERQVECRVVKVHVARGNSVERAAREARYAALLAARADYIVLAHNADDQAETVLLQLLRGTGVKGLAAMPFLRTPEHSRRIMSGNLAKRRHASPLSSHPLIIRPLLTVSRAHIAGYAQRRKLAWIEDESNEDRTYQRNWLRQDVLPLIATRVPAYRATLTRAANHFAEADALLDDLGRVDAGESLFSGTISVDRLQSLSEARAKNVLRVMIASQGWPMPQADRLREAVRQALSARADAKVRVELGGCELRRHREMLHLLPTRADPGVSSVITWRGEPELVLPSLGGVLSMTPRRGMGIRVEPLRSEVVTIRARAGGERLQCDADHPRRTVKNLLQEAGVPAWERARLPFIYCGNTLVCIPGLGVHHLYQASAEEAAISPTWQVF